MQKFKNCLIAAALLACTVNAADTPKKGGMIFNQDCSQFFMALKYPANEEGVKKYIDEHYLVAGHDVTEFMVNPNARRSLVPTRNMELMWDGFNFLPDGKIEYRGKILSDAYTKMIKRMKAFPDQGLDYCKIWFDHLRSKGVSPWISMRMNDTHGPADPDAPGHSAIWRDNPQWRVANHRSHSSDWYMQMDYAQKEVFDHYLSVAIDYINNYDVDGIELDFMRHGRIFKHGEEVRNRHIMTDFIRQVHECAQARAKVLGHPVKIAVRIPATPEDAWYLGYDVEEWCKKGYIYMVIPSTFLHTTYGNTPIRAWRRVVGENVLIAPCHEARKNSSPEVTNYIDWRVSFGMSANWLYQGADRIYSFNHFGINNGSMTKSGRLETVAKLTRRNLLTWIDMRAPGISPVRPMPHTVTPGNATYSGGEFRIECGPKPAPGRNAYVIFASREVNKIPSMKVWINSKGPLNICAIPHYLQFEAKAKGKVAYRIPLNYLNDGDNLIEITDAAGTFKINWVEIYYE